MTLQSRNTKSHHCQLKADECLSKRQLRCPISSISYSQRSSFKHLFVWPQKCSKNQSQSWLLASWKWLSHSAHKAKAVITKAFPMSQDSTKGCTVDGPCCHCRKFKQSFSRHREQSILLTRLSELKITFPLPHRAHPRVSSLHQN